MHDYDRRQATSLKGILRLIVHAALNERPIQRLCEAYVEDLVHDDGEPGFGTVAERDAWRRQHLGMLFGHEIEAAMRHAHAQVYKAMAPWSNAAEVFDSPYDMPTSEVPREVAEAIGRELGRRDGAEARALRETYQARHPS